MSKKIKILHLLECLDTGGAETLVLKWTKAFINQYDIHIISLREGALLSEFKNTGASVSILEKRGAFDLFFLVKLKQLIKQIKPDVINAHNGIPIISYGVEAARLNRVPIVCTIHGRTHYRDINFKTKLWFRQLRKADRVVTVTKSIAVELKTLAKIDEKKVDVIYNGIEVKTYQEKNKEDYLEEFNLSKDLTIIGTVGRLRKIKGHHHLIKALPAVLDVFPKVKLVIVGEGEELETLKNLVKELNIEKSVVFAGLRSDAPQMMKMFDLFVLPSDSEGLPLVILEAMSAEVPILATEVGGLSEVIENGKTGALIPPSNGQLLAKRIIKILQNYDMSCEYAKRAFKEVLPRFDIKTTHQSYNKLYESLI